MKRFYLPFRWGLILLVIAVAGCAGVPQQPAAVEAKPIQALSGPPVITNSFASPHLRPGETWRVFLRAADPNGEMKNIVCVIDQPGVGEYPVSITRIEGDSSKDLNGYIYLTTSAFDRLDWVDLTLTVQIQDTAGQYSKPLQFHLDLNDRYSQDPPPPGAFEDRGLGPILIHVHGLSEEGPGFFFRHER